MKKLGVILSLSIIMVLMNFSMCFASGLELLDSYPKDGSDQARPENFLVKLYFNEDVSATEVQDNIENAFKFTDSKGKTLSTKVLYDSKKPKEIWVLVNETLESGTSYELYISGDLENANGDTLGEDKIISLKTRNTNTDNNVNMALMGVMMVGMIFFTSLNTKRQIKKQEEEAKTAEDIKVNPYKVAKETGKSVEDIVAKTEKEKEKARQKEEKRSKSKAGSQKEEDVPGDDEISKDTKRVTGPKPIAAAGSTYITGRKAQAEKEREKAAAKAAAGTTRPKHATGKDRNRKANKK